LHCHPVERHSASPCADHRTVGGEGDDRPAMQQPDQPDDVIAAQATVVPPTLLRRVMKAKRHGLPPAPERKRTITLSVFIRTHLVLLAGTDFFTAEVLTLRGLMTYYVLFFIHLESRRVDIAGSPSIPTSHE
jgi:hypothetical protein